MTSAWSFNHIDMSGPASVISDQAHRPQREVPDNLAQNKTLTKIKSRKRVNTAEKRASHNAVERQRRETLNSRFLDLARLLPSLAAVRRPSKSAIVNGSIDHLGHGRNHRLSAARELRRMFAEKQELLDEVNEWRNRNGLSARVATGWTRDMEEILSVESEVFGDFTGMGNGDGDDLDGDDERDVPSGDYNQCVLERNVPQAPNRPRSSLELNGQQHGHSHLQRSSYRTFTNEIDSRSSLQSSIADPEPVGAAPFVMIGKHNSYTSTDTSSVISGSPPHVHPMYDGGKASPIGTSQQYALQAFLKAGEAAVTDPSHHSPGAPSGDCITPPSHEANIEVRSFAPSSPPVAPTSFAQIGTEPEKVSEWAAQQGMLQYVPERSYQDEAFSTKRGPADVGFANSYVLHDDRSASGILQHQSQHQNPASRLSATHQALLTCQPQLAAAVFPPPFAEIVYPSTSVLSTSDTVSCATPGSTGFLGYAQLQHYPPVNSATLALGARLNAGMTYSQIEHWSRSGGVSNELCVGATGERMAEYGHAPYLDVSMSMSSEMRRSG